MPPTRPDLVIFDCDGVLVDTERLVVPIDVQVLAGFGWEITEEEVIERFLGRSEADCNREIEAHLGRKLPTDWSFEIEDRYREAFARDLKAVDGVFEVLDALQAADIPVRVASSGSHEKMRFTLGLTGLWERLEGAIHSADDVDRGKPEPDLFLAAAAAGGVEPARCAVIEDSPFGIAGALAAGMAAYGYAGGLTPRKRLAIPGAILFDNMGELPALLGI